MCSGSSSLAGPCLPCALFQPCQLSQQRPKLWDWEARWPSSKNRGKRDAVVCWVRTQCWAQWVFSASGVLIVYQDCAHCLIYNGLLNLTTPYLKHPIYSHMGSACEKGAITIPILQMTKAQGSEVNWIFEGSGESGISCEISICKSWQLIQIF